MQLEVESAGISDVGLVRHNNEDVWGQLEQYYFYALADGMGGHRAGEVAAKEAVDALLQIVKKKFSEISPEKQTLQEMRDLVHDAIVDVNSIVYAISTSNSAYRGMGTTLCCIAVHPTGVIYAHVGDSRIYCLTDGHLKQLTDDHTLAYELIDAGRLDRDKAAGFLYKNIITKSIGNEPFVEPSVASATLHGQDTFLICSDGLTDMLTPPEIQKIMLHAKDAKSCVEDLVDAAKSSGGIDNITVVVIKIKRKK